MDTIEISHPDNSMVEYLKNRRMLNFALGKDVSDQLFNDGWFVTYHSYKKVIFEDRAWRDLTGVIEYIIIAAKRLDVKIGFKFNTNEFIWVHKTDTYKKVHDRVTVQRKKDYKAFKKTDEYKARIKAFHKERNAIQAKIDELEDKFERLNLSNYHEVLLWLEEYIPVSDYRFAKANCRYICNKLVAAGYKGAEHAPDPNIDWENREVVAKYIIGQLISITNHYGIFYPGLADWISSKYMPLVK